MLDDFQDKTGIGLFIYINGAIRSPGCTIKTNEKLVQYLVLVLFGCNFNYVALSVCESEYFESDFHQIVA